MTKRDPITGPSATRERILQKSVYKQKTCHKAENRLTKINKVDKLPKVTLITMRREYGRIIRIDDDSQCTHRFTDAPKRPKPNKRVTRGNKLER
jgi:hypothetical protein